MACWWYRNVGSHKPQYFILGYCLQGAKALGGVRLLYSPEEVEVAAADMIGDFLITKQTGADGRYNFSVSFYR